MTVWLLVCVVLAGACEGAGKAAADPMHHAIVLGDLPTVRELVGLGYPVNPPPGERMALAPLTAAAGAGDVEVIRFLLEAGAQPDAVGGRRMSPLTAAARAGRIDAIRVLLDAGTRIEGHGSEALSAAIRYEQDEAVAVLIEAGVDVNATPRGGRPPLVQAASSGQAPITKRLLQAGAGLEAVDRRGWSAITWAVRNAEPQTLRLLLEAGGDPMAAGLTPLMAAVVRGHREEAGELLEEGAELEWVWRLRPADEGPTALMIAVGLGDEAMVERLLAAGADPKMGGRRFRGERPLHRALRRGHEGIARALLAAGAEVGARQDSGMTPLHYAAWYGPTAMIPVLIEAGADVADRETKRRETALHLAAVAGRVETVRALLEAGASHDPTDGSARMPIHYAARSGGVATVRALLDGRVDLQSPGLRHLLPNLWHDASAEVIPLLIANGLDPNGRNAHFKGGKTPLMIVSERGDPAGVAAMLAAGADVRTSGRDGIHALSQAIGFGRPDTMDPELVRLLIEAGAPVNPNPEEYVLPLVIAAGESNYAVVELLLAAGADPNRAAADGTTPLMAAAARNRYYDPYIVRLLLEAGADPGARNNAGQRAIDLIPAGRASHLLDRVRRLLEQPPLPV